jgi:hypothetical protein
MTVTSTPTTTVVSTLWATEPDRSSPEPTTAEHEVSEGESHMITLKRLSLVVGAAVGIAMAPSSAQAIPVLFDGGFDLNSPLTTFAGIVSPFTTGQWAAENAINTGATGGVTPNSDGRMLRMLSDGLTITQAGQAVPVDPGDYLTLGALFTTDSAASGAKASVFMDFYANVNSWNSPLASFSSGPLTLDANPATWQALSVSGLAPAGAHWGMFQVAYDDTSLGGHAGYVDSVTLAAVPEPASLVLLGTGLVGVLLSDRHRRRALRSVSRRSLVPDTIA